MKKLLGIIVIMVMLAGFGCAGAKVSSKSVGKTEAYAVSQTEDGKALLLYMSPDLDTDKTMVVAKGGKIASVKAGDKVMMNVTQPDGKTVNFLLDPLMEKDVKKQYEGDKK